MPHSQALQAEQSWGLALLRAFQEGSRHRVCCSPLPLSPPWAHWGGEAPPGVTAESLLSLGVQCSQPSGARGCGPGGLRCSEMVCVPEWQILQLCWGV